MTPMNKNSRNHTRSSRARTKNEESLRYMPITPLAADVLVERFFDYERRLAEIEDQLRAESAVSAIDIDRL